MGTVTIFVVFNPEIKSTPMKVTAFIRKTAKKNDTDTKATVYFRLRDGKKDIKAASELLICPNHWSPERQGYKDRVALVSENEKSEFNHKVQELTHLIENGYTSDADSEWLGTVIDKFHHPQNIRLKRNWPQRIRLRLPNCLTSSLSSTRCPRSGRRISG